LPPVLGGELVPPVPKGLPESVGEQAKAARDTKPSEIETCNFRMVEDFHWQRVRPLVRLISIVRIGAKIRTTNAIGVAV
jgi:hypothetical protein